MLGSWEVFACGFAVFVGLWVQGEAMDASPACDFPAIYNFGDSNSDTGGKSAAFKLTGPPNGETFFHKPAGRPCNGRLIIDFITEQLKLPYLSAYLDSLGTNYRHGANFATGGSTVRRQSETVGKTRMSPVSLDVQIMQFNQFKQRSSDLYTQAKDSGERNKLPVQDEFSKALYTFDIGQNDLTVWFWRKESPDQLKATLRDIMNQIASAVQNIYEKGGRSFWIHNTGPIGCLPMNVVENQNLTLRNFDKNRCIKSHNKVAKKFNRILKKQIIKLRTELPEAAITYVDVYAAKYGLISSAKKQGFTDPMTICCGYHIDKTHIWCGTKGLSANRTEVFGGSCEKPATSISWDGVHYTESANKWVASRIVNGSLSDPPIPITQACHRHQ